MLTYDLKECLECGNLTEVIEKIDRELWLLAERKLDNEKFNLGLCVNVEKFEKLAFYKRVLEKRYHNPSYLACCDLTLVDMTSAVGTMLTSTKRSRCWSTTTTTSSSETTTTSTTTSTTSSTTTTTTTV